MAAAAPAIEKAGAGIGHYLWVCLKAIGRFFMWCFSLVQKCLTRLPIKWASLLLRVLNLGNAVLLAAACVFIFMKASNAGVNLSVTQVFLSVYIGVFALLLGAFEMRVKWTEGSIRRNFGFMFTYMGRALFLIFLSAVCFGMLNSDQQSTPWYSWAAGAGAGTLINAVINCIIICSHPGFQEMAKQAEEEHGGGSATKAGEDPTKMSEEQIAAYLKAHPEIAAKALSAATASGATPAQPAGSGFTGDAAGTGAASEGVAEWGAVSSKPGHSPAAEAASAKPSGGGFFGFGKKGKATAGKGAGASAAESEMAPYQPPAAAAGFSDVAITGGGAADGDNPFAAPSGSPPAPAGRAASPAASAHPPAPSRALPPQPAHQPSSSTSSAAVIVAPSDLEDNPFAS